MYECCSLIFAIDSFSPKPAPVPEQRYLITTMYTEQKKKRNNYISLNFEQSMIQSEIIAFSASALDIRLPNARNRFSF